MKKLIAIWMTALSLTGCTSFLNVETLGKSTISGFFADIDGLKAAGLGLHRLITEFYDDEYLRMGDLAGDEMVLYRVNASQALQLIYDFQSTSADNSGYPQMIWKHGYEICTNANNILFYRTCRNRSCCVASKATSMIIARHLDFGMNICNRTARRITDKTTNIVMCSNLPD